MQWEHRRSYHACQNWYLGFGFITNTISRSTRAFIFFPFQARALPMDGGREITDMMLGFYESRGILLSPPTTRKTAPGFFASVRTCLIPCVDLTFLHNCSINILLWKYFRGLILFKPPTLNSCVAIYACVYFLIAVSLSFPNLRHGWKKVLLFLSIYFYTSTFCYIKIRLYTLYTMYSY